MSKADIADLQPDTRPAHLKIADALRTRIAFGAYTPGQRLPSERELAETLGVGRMTIRAAVRTLATEGRLETIRGRNGGTFVADPQLPRKGAGRNKREIVNAGREVRQTYEFRLILEPPVARMCAESATESALSRIVELAGEEPTSIAHYRALDSRFHLAIAAACGNRLASDALKTAREQFFIWADAFFDVEWTPQLVWSRASASEHRAIAKAMQERKGQRAARLMTKHLEAGFSVYDEIVKQGGLPDGPKNSKR